MYTFVINDQLNKKYDISNLALQIFIVPIFHNLPIFFCHPRQTPYRILHRTYIQSINILMKNPWQDKVGSGLTNIWLLFKWKKQNTKPFLAQQFINRENYWRYWIIKGGVIKPGRINLDCITINKMKGY